MHNKHSKGMTARTNERATDERTNKKGYTKQL